MPHAAIHALGIRRDDRWLLEVHDGAGDGPVLSSTLVLSGLDLPPATVLDMLLGAKDLERAGDWLSGPDGIWVAPVQPVGS